MQLPRKFLILVPTAAELDAIPTEVKCSLLDRGVTIELSGLGPIAAAATAARLCRDRDVEHVVLIGLAGTYDVSVCRLGEAYSFRSVAFDGIGAGWGEDYRSACELGWPERFAATAVGEQLTLSSLDPEAAGQLLTVAAASGSADHAIRRKQRFPAAVAEDMESYAVAAVCLQLGMHLWVIRGISNVAGDRDHSGWQIESAMSAAGRQAVDLVVSLQR